MTYTSEASDALWTEASGDREAEVRDTALTQARLGWAEHWPTLAGAQSRSGFMERLAVLEPSLDAICTEATKLDPGLMPVVKRALVDESKKDFIGIERQRKAAAARTAAAQADEYRARVAAAAGRFLAASEDDDDDRPAFLKDKDDDDSSSTDDRDSDSDDDDDDDDDDDSGSSSDSDSDDDGDDDSDDDSDDDDDDSGSSHEAIYHVVVEGRELDRTASLSEARTLAKLVGGRVLVPKGRATHVVAAADWEEPTKLIEQLEANYDPKLEAKAREHLRRKNPRNAADLQRRLDTIRSRNAPNIHPTTLASRIGEVLVLPRNANPDCPTCNGGGVVLVLPPDQVGAGQVMPVIAPCPDGDCVGGGHPQANAAEGSGDGAESTQEGSEDDDGGDAPSSDSKTSSVRTEAVKWSPMSGAGNKERLKPYSPTHTYNPIGWDVFDARPHPGSQPIEAGSDVMVHGKMDPQGHLLHVQDEAGNHQTVDRRSVKRAPKQATDEIIPKKWYPTPGNHFTDCEHCGSTIELDGSDPKALWRHNNRWLDQDHMPRPHVEQGVYTSASMRVAEAHPPYYIREDGGKYKVVDSLGKSRGEHDSEESAREQQKALYANVPGASEKAEEDHGHTPKKVQESGSKPKEGRRTKVAPEVMPDDEGDESSAEHEAGLFRRFMSWLRQTEGDGNATEPPEPATPAPTTPPMGTSSPPPTTPPMGTSSPPPTPSAATTTPTMPMTPFSPQPTMPAPASNVDRQNFDAARRVGKYTIRRGTTPMGKEYQVIDTATGLVVFEAADRAECHRWVQSNGTRARAHATKQADFALDPQPRVHREVDPSLCNETHRDAWTGDPAQCSLPRGHDGDHTDHVTGTTWHHDWSKEAPSPDQGAAIMYAHLQWPLTCHGCGARWAQHQASLSEDMRCPHCASTDLDLVKTADPIPFDNVDPLSNIHLPEGGNPGEPQLPGEDEGEEGGAEAGAAEDLPIAASLRRQASPWPFVRGDGPYEVPGCPNCGEPAKLFGHHESQTSRGFTAMDCPKCGHGDVWYHDDPEFDAPYQGKFAGRRRKASGNEHPEEIPGLGTEEGNPTDGPLPGAPPGQDDFAPTRNFEARMAAIAADIQATNPGIDPHLAWTTAERTARRLMAR